MTNEIWVFGDLRHKRLFRFSLNVLAKAQELSRSVDGKAVMVLPGVPGNVTASSEDSDSVSFSSALEKSFARGADRVYVLENKRFLVPQCDVFAEALAGVVKERTPMLVMFALTDFGRETAARVACNCSAG
ncbi:MAG: XRE family transcriptional regulator, partial [Deltaproteobacteria bacterium]|nr:XRE family transcriptional regulator [Deltaproteobacteria bacterium]